MYKKILIIFFLSFFLFIQNKSIAQIDFIIEVQWIIYRMPDTNINVTKYINQDGKFNFERGFIDTSLIIKNRNFLRLKNNNWENYKLKYNFIEGIDTIQSFRRYNINYADSGKIIRTNRKNCIIESFEDNLLKDVRFSYILDKLDKTILNDSSHQDVLQLIYPFKNNSYKILKIEFKDESAKLFNKLGASNDLKGIQIIESDSVKLYKSDIKRIKKKLCKIDACDETECIGNKNLWLFEYKKNNNYKRYIFSFDCDINRDLDPIVIFSFYLKKLNDKISNTAN
jgi:hypothetical protein